jgi:hypothetical protein
MDFHKIGPWLYLTFGSKKSGMTMTAAVHTQMKMDLTADLFERRVAKLFL